MTLSTIERRFVASMLSRLSVGGTVAGIFYLLWPSSAGEFPAVLFAFLVVVSLAAGSFGALFWLTSTRHDG